MRKTSYNTQGQPDPGFHFANNEIKAINTLYGLIMGITADRTVTDDEIIFLKLWLDNNADYLNTFPLNVIKRRIEEILADGIITHDERENLYDILTELQGNDFYDSGMAGGFSNGIFLEEPNFLRIKDSQFCLTGEFVSGPRNRCEQTLSKFGGILSKSITKKLDYLIVGTMGSRDWITAGHGRKIEKALHYKQQGHQITIMSEESLLKFVTIT
jgi:hypothetical protein